MVWVTAILVNMIALAQGAYGTDQVENYYRGLMAQQAQLHKQEKDIMVGKIKLMEQVLLDVAGDDLPSKVKSLMADLGFTKEQKDTLEQKQAELQRQIAEIKVQIGENGEDTPLPVQIKKLRQSAESGVESKKLLEKRLSNIPGDGLMEKVEFLKEALKDTEETNESLAQHYVIAQHQIAEIATELGESGGDTPAPARARKLSNSLKQDATNLEEAVSVIEQKLDPVSGGDCVGKVDTLITELANKTNILKEMHEAAKEKEEAYSKLSLELRRVTSEAQELDAALSLALVQASINQEKFFDVLRKQFNS
jgi:hypothetical protein